MLLEGGASNAEQVAQVWNLATAGKEGRVMTLNLFPQISGQVFAQFRAGAEEQALHGREGHLEDLADLLVGQFFVTA